MLRTLRHIASTFALLAFFTASAQLCSLRTYRGEPISCCVSGLIYAYQSCGTNGSYAEILSGTILSSEDIPATGSGSAVTKLRIHPDEMFRGESAPELVAVTDAPGCFGGNFFEGFGGFEIGSKWLFYMRRDKKTGKLELDYALSKPLAESAASLPLLRLQAKSPHSGVIQGKAEQSDDPKIAFDFFAYASADENLRRPLPNHTILLHSAQGADRSTATDDQGFFRFDPLDPGKYTVDMNTHSGLWVDTQPVDVSPQSCADVDRILVADGEIAGRWIRYDHSPVAKEYLEAVPLEVRNETGAAEFYSLRQTDEQGRFTFHGLPPGRYEVVHRSQFDVPGSPTLYYPDTVLKQHASIITLTKDETRDDLVLTCPKGASEELCPAPEAKTR